MVHLERNISHVFGRYGNKSIVVIGYNDVSSVNATANITVLDVVDRVQFVGLPYHVPFNTSTQVMLKVRQKTYCRPICNI